MTSSKSLGHLQSFDSCEKLQGFESLKGGAKKFIEGLCEIIWGHTLFDSLGYSEEYTHSGSFLCIALPHW